MSDRRAVTDAATRTAPASVMEVRAMRRALELASRGPAGGQNPRVGCVLLASDGATIGEGWHRGAGTPHAEADALAHVDGDGARGATAVVTLEPCDHRGRTGPCSVALIEAGVARVVFAVPDPNPAASGGAARLEAAGIEVVAGLEQQAALALNETWFASVRLGRPWVTAKWASSLDGRTAASDGSSRWISSATARADVHRRRAEHGAILVGTGTALADDPALTARDADGELLPHQPIPVVLGERSLPETAAVHRHPLPLVRPTTHDPAAALAELDRMGIRSVFVEGGPTVVSALARAGLIDEYLIYLAPTLLGGDRLATGDLGVPTIGLQRRLAVRQVQHLGDDLLIVARPVHPEGDH